MTSRLDLQDFANILIENAYEDFHKTERFRCLCEKNNKALDIYENKLSENEKRMLNEYFEALMELQSAETEFFYLQGIKDCVHILKGMTVIM